MWCDRGRDPHLHVQVFLPPGIRRRHSQRCFAEPLFTNEKKGAIHETSYGMQVLGLHALQAHLFAIVLPLCRMFFSLGLRVESSPVFKTFFQVHLVLGAAGWNPQHVRSYSLGCIPPIWVPQVLVSHHCHHVFANFWMRQSRPLLFFPRVINFSTVTTIACCPFH